MHLFFFFLIAVTSGSLFFGLDYKMKGLKKKKYPTQNTSTHKTSSRLPHFVLDVSNLGLSQILVSGRGFLAKENLSISQILPIRAPLGVSWHCEY